MSSERLRSPQHDRARKKSAPIPVTTTQPESDIERLLQLQRTIGNQATLRLSQTGVIQLGRRGRRGKKGGGGGGGSTPTPTSTPTLSQEEIRKRIAAGQKRREQEKAAKNSWGAWFASWIPGGTYEAPSEDNDEEEDAPTFHFQDTEVEGDESVFTGETELGDAPAEEEEPSTIANPFAIEQLELDLGSGKMEKKGTAIGDVSASGKDSITGDGAYNVSGKGGAEGRFGKAEGEGKLKLSTDNLEGEGKASMLFGGSSEHKTGTLGWGIGAHKLEGSGTMESKVGLSGDLAAKLAYSSSKFAAEGKMGAFLGALAETTVNINLKSNGKALGSSQGKIGVAYGAGGELKGTITWEGGKFEFGWQGKLVAGVGFSYGYKLTLNTDAIATTMTGWLPTIKYWLWDAWSLPDDVDLDDILII